MPKLVRYVLMNSAAGIAFGWLVAFGLVHFNVGHLGELYAHSDHKVAATALLALTFGITFGFAFVATAVMLIPTDKDNFDRM
ncbi:hypothetical protein [Oricola sp.]|uniref:hypothetical protein n=1 Tax=Oricola sp. TaxID=1979950 RepID=UPI003BACF842